MSMTPGQGDKLVASVERMAAALEKSNSLSKAQVARAEMVALELYYLRAFLVGLVGLLQPDLKEEVEKLAAKLSPPTPPKVLAPEPEEQTLSIEERVQQALSQFLAAPSQAQPAQRQRPPQTGHQVIPQGAKLGQSLRDKLKTPPEKPKLLQPEPEEPEEGFDLRKFADRKAPTQ